MPAIKMMRYKLARLVQGLFWVRTGRKQRSEKWTAIEGTPDANAQKADIPSGNDKKARRRLG
jgi:hypothetical protein